VLAGLLAAGAVLVWLADLFYGPYLYAGWQPKLSLPQLYALAAGVGAAGALFALARPVSSRQWLRVLAVTDFILLCFKLGAFTEFGLSLLPLTPEQQYWVFRGPGGGVFGGLPSALGVLIGGSWWFGMSLREQWNGRLSFHWRDLFYGGLFAVAMSGVGVIGAYATGAARVAWEPNWAGHGVNLASNLYEEIIARGLLLQVSRKAFGTVFAAIWTGVVFGMMHGFGWFGLITALVGWLFVLPVLWSGSLWGGWVSHQLQDVIIDSLLH
jgi:membrane protease YdiL (CAAX protease family)